MREKGLGNLSTMAKARLCHRARQHLSARGARVSARVKYSGGGGGMGSKAYTISSGSMAYQAPGSSYLHITHKL